MVIPSENHKILTNIGKVDQFDFERPTRIPQRVNITSYGGAKYVLENQDKYKVMWDGFAALMGEGGARFMLSGDTTFHAQQRKTMHSQLYRAWLARRRQGVLQADHPSSCCRRRAISSPASGT